MLAILGAGPCRLACAWELTRLGHKDWILFEAAATPGGLGGSVVDERGFTWDNGGHVVFSHFGEFDRLLDEVLGPDFVEHERSSYVRFENSWVPYPFQNNLRYLPREVTIECLAGLAHAGGGRPDMDFMEWMRETFGAGITERFMRPYNFKVWATPAERMASTWIAERVAVVDFERALRSVLDERDDLGWGPNNRFRFPLSGGTGEIYRRLAARLGDRVKYRSRAVAVNAREHRIDFADGTSCAYDSLLTTVPIDLFVAGVEDAPAPVRSAAAGLEHNSVYVVGVGFERPLSDDRSWMYFPDSAVPFYRATNFAKYSPCNVPGGDVRHYSSYMTETSYSRHKPVDRSTLEEDVVNGLHSTGLVPSGTPVASVHVIDVPYAYPVPTRDRDDRLRAIQPWLMGHGIYSRGRFGAWRYEAGNMDHAVKMGVDAARHLAHGAPEELWTL